jgi:hypothetical protein
VPAWFQTTASVRLISLPHPPIRKEKLYPSRCITSNALHRTEVQGERCEPREPKPSRAKTCAPGKACIPDAQPSRASVGSTSAHAPYIWHVQQTHVLFNCCVGNSSICISESLYDPTVLAMESSLVTRLACLRCTLCSARDSWSRP